MVGCMVGCDVRGRMRADRTLALGMDTVTLVDGCNDGWLAYRLRNVSSIVRQLWLDFREHILAPWAVDSVNSQRACLPALHHSAIVERSTFNSSAAARTE